LIWFRCYVAAPKLINVVGPEPLSFHDMINIMLQMRKKKFRIVEMPKVLTDILITYGVSIMLPKLISSQQYQLLFEDNIADTSEVLRSLDVSTWDQIPEGAFKMIRHNHFFEPSGNKTIM